VFADGARVEHDNVGVLGAVRGLVAGLFEQARHALGIVHVHLAAVRFDEVCARHPILSVISVTTGHSH